MTPTALALVSVLAISAAPSGEGKALVPMPLAELVERYRAEPPPEVSEIPRD